MSASRVIQSGQRPETRKRVAVLRKSGASLRGGRWREFWWGGVSSSIFPVFLNRISFLGAVACTVLPHRSSQTRIDLRRLRVTSVWKCYSKLEMDPGALVVSVSNFKVLKTLGCRYIKAEAWYKLWQRRGIISLFFHGTNPQSWTSMISLISPRRSFYPPFFYGPHGGHHIAWSCRRSSAPEATWFYTTHGLNMQKKGWGW